MLQDQGRLEQALESYRASLAIRERLGTADPSNAGWQRDLSLSLMRVALVQEAQGDAATALPLARDALAIFERLTGLDPTNAIWHQDLEFARSLVARLEGAAAG